MASQRPRQATAPRRFLPRPPERYQVAWDAACRLYSGQCKEYFQAKQEAGRGRKAAGWPSNREVQQQLGRLGRRREGAALLRRLAEMRTVAWELMTRLSAYHPRLIGSTWTGTLRPASDIDVNVFCDQPQALVELLQAAGWEAHPVAAARPQEGPHRTFLHFRVGPIQGYPVELTVYPEAEKEQPRQCTLTGRPMPFATLDRLRAVLDATEEAPVPLPDDLRGEAWPQEFPLALEAAARAWPERAGDLLALRSWQEELAQGFPSFADRSGRLDEHFRAAAGRYGSPARVLALAGSLRLSSDWGRAAAWLPSEREAGNRLDALRERLVLAARQEAPLALACELLAEAGARLPELVLLAARFHGDEEVLELGRELLDEYFDFGFYRWPIFPVAEDDLEWELGLPPGRESRRLWWRLAALYIEGELPDRDAGLVWAQQLWQRERETSRVELTTRKAEGREQGLEDVSDA